MNLAEVIRKMLQIGVPITELEALLRELNLDVDEEFSARQAFAAAQLGHDARAHGLSLCDCVCLTMAGWMGGVDGPDRDYGGPPVVRDRDLNVKVVQIR